MMQRTKWTERKFTFDFPEGWLSNILERLRGTTPRIKDMIAGLNDEQLTLQPQGKWSIKEHIGHLADLEQLHEGRIDDFLNRKDTLRAADMTNKKTEEAHHNTKDIQTLITEFNTKREMYISRIEQLDEATQKFKSLHPRLQTMVRPVDIAYFTAEHDDHHLADIRDIINSIRLR